MLLHSMRALSLPWGCTSSDATGAQPARVPRTSEKLALTKTKYVEQNPDTALSGLRSVASHLQPTTTMDATGPAIHKSEQVWMPQG